MELNGYFFRALLKKTRRRFALRAGEQALYQELVDICNEENWCTSFQVSNGELTTALNCNEKTLAEWRQSLVNAGLLKYDSGKSKRAFGNYELVVETTVKITTNRPTNRGTNTSDYYKLNETEQNQTSFSPAAPEGRKKAELEHWKSLVAKWFEYYEQKMGQPPTFPPSMAAHLKSIVQRIKKMSDQKNFEWTEQQATKSLHHFLAKAWEDDWLRANFLLTNLSTKFDSIVNSKANGIAKAKPATGGAVSTGSLLAKINAMPD